MSSTRGGARLPRARTIVAVVLCAGVLLGACTSSAGDGDTATVGASQPDATVASGATDEGRTADSDGTGPGGTDAGGTDAGGTVEGTTPASGAAVPRGLVGAWSVPASDLARLAELGANAVFTQPRTPQELDGFVEEARRLGLYVFFSPVEAQDAMVPGCADRCPFDLDRYREALRAFADATSARGDAAFLPDEPFDPSNWGGTPMTWEDVGEAARAVREILAVPAIVNVGELRGPVPAGAVDGVSVTFYRNKLQRHGSLEAYLAAQAATLGGSTPLIVLLQASAGGSLGSLEPDEIASQTVEACTHPDVVGVLWWTWLDKRDTVGLGTRLADPAEGAELADRLAAAAAACTP